MCILLEGTRCDTAAATCRWDLVIWRPEGLGNTRIGAWCAVASHAGAVAVEHGGVDGIGSISVVIHILAGVLEFHAVRLLDFSGSTYGLVAGVSTLVTKSCLVSPEEVSVTSEQVGL